MEIDVTAALALLAIIVEGPILWWLTKQHRKEDSMNASIRKIHERIDDVESTYATKDEMERGDAHVKEVLGIQYNTIIEELRYIRSRVDERSKDSER